VTLEIVSRHALRHLEPNFVAYAFYELNGAW